MRRFLLRFKVKGAKGNCHESIYKNHVGATKSAKPIKARHPSWLCKINLVDILSPKAMRRTPVNPFTVMIMVVFIIALAWMMMTAVVAPSVSVDGVSDHGDLTGLADDDHPQYHTDARGDARYYTEVELDAGQLDTRYYTEAELDGGQLDTRYYTEAELDAGQLDTRYYTEGETDAEIATHDALITDTHGVGTGTITSVSTANKDIHVDKEATGADDGTSWADAFTTIQDAVDSMEDLIIHAYTISVRDGTKKTGTADENTANHLVDDANSQFVVGDVGKRVFNVDDGTWGVVTAYNDAGDLTLAADTFPDGDEDYVMEATPYRETVYLNSNPTVNPAHLVLGSVLIRAEFYFNASCDANAVAGAIVDASYDFSDIEVGDRCWVLDLNGANDRAQDYEYGTIDDVTNAATGTLGTTLTKTPTTNWKYGIVKTEISGSDDGTNPGTARNYIFLGAAIDKVSIYGFYMTFSNTQAVHFHTGSDGVAARYNALEDCDNGLRCLGHSSATYIYNYIEVDEYALWVEYESVADINYNVIYTKTGTERAIYVVRHSYAKIQRNNIDTAAGGADGEGLIAWYNSMVEISRCNITNGFLTGINANLNSAVDDVVNTNNATIPEVPAGTSEGAYIK